MARESNVESRIATILDFKRPLSRHITWKTACTIAVVTLGVIGSTAAIHPVQAVDETGSLVKDEGKMDEATVRVHGQVTDESGQPIANANVSVWRVHKPNWYAADNIGIKVGELEVDAEGRFDQTFPESELPDRDNRYGGQWSVLVVKASGHAIRAMRGFSRTYEQDGAQVLAPNFLAEAVTVELPKSVKIRGKIVSIEGLPVANAKIEVYSAAVTKPDKLDAWLENADTTPQKDDYSMAMGGPPVSERLFPAHPSALPLEAVETVQSDENGEFEVIDLIAEDDICVFRVTGADIAYKLLHVLGRDMNTVYGSGITNVTKTVAHHGRNFNYVAAPSVPVHGIVRDAETKKPLVDTWVAIGGIYGATMSQSGIIRTRTDSAGHYRIEGLPLVPTTSKTYRRNRLEIRPGKLPYMETDVVVPIGNGTDPIELDIELRRGVLAEGQLTNKKGEPIANANLWYSPYSNNEHCAKYARYADNTKTVLGNDTRYTTNEDGKFSIPVIPGRGVIGAKTIEGSFVPAFGAKTIEAFQKDAEGDDPISYKLSDHIMHTTFQSLVEIDVPEDASPHDVAMQVDEGISMVVRFVDPDGKPLTGVRGGGLISNGGWKTIEEDHATAEGLEIDTIRAIRFLHTERELSRFARIIPDGKQKEFVLELLPYGSMTGRIVDPEGRPVVDATVQAMHQNDPAFSSSLQQVSTDAEGRFTVKLPVGVKYEIQVQVGNQFRTVEPVDMTSEPMQVTLGDLEFDEYAERWSAITPKQEREVTPLAAK